MRPNRHVLRNWGRAVLFAVLVSGLVTGCGSPNKTGKLVAVQTSFGLNDAQDGRIDKMDFGGVVTVELDDGTEVEAIWDKKLGADFIGGMELEIAPTEDPDYWKVVRIVSNPQVKGSPKKGKPVGDRQRQIAFVSDRNGNSEIFVVNADGSELKRLTTHEAEDSSPTMSPDGKKIAFISDRDGNSKIYVVNTDGTGLTRLTNGSGNELWPKWSPSGKQIAFWSRDATRSDIFVMDADGSNSANLTQDAQEDLYPNWMPEGNLIVFLSLRDGGYQFYSISTDGSGLEKLDSGLPPSKHDPSKIMGIFIDAEISSRQIQFFTKKEGIVPFEDPGSALGEFPAWSPDGSKIAFHSNRDGKMEIYVVDEDRSHLRRLTTNDAYDMFPCWSPDGKKIAFQSNRDGNLDIYVMDADGSNPIRLTRHTAKDSQPAWCS